MAPDKRDELYNNLINSGRVTENEIGTIDDFKAAITDEATAKEFHQNLLNSGIFTISDIGDAADFWLSIRDDFSQPTAATQPTAQQPTQRNMGTPGYVPNRFGIPTQQGMGPVADVAPHPMTPAQPQQSRRQYDYRPMQGSGSVQTPAAEQPAYRPQAAPKPQQPTYQQAQQQQPIYNTQAETPAAPEFRNTQKMYSDAADKAWQKAEQDTKALREANTKKIEDIYNDEHSTMLGKMAMAQTRATALPIEGMAASLKAHDMEKMADDAWGYVSDDDKEYLIDGFKREIMREAARSGGSGGTMSQEEAEKALREEAERRAKARQYQAMYDKAVAANAPKDVLDFLQRKIVEGNSLSKLAIAAARTIAGTRGDMDARAVATHDYGKGHRVADIAGSVLQIATDPVTWAAGGAGKGAVKGATAIAERAAGAAATRRLAASKGGQLAQRMIGGSANFAAFEGLGNIVEQLQQGGVYNEETGQYEYSLKDVAKAAGHGVLLGGATGVVGGLVGNVGDKVFDRVASTAGKLAVRGGQTLTSIAAEGTIFAAPELISGEGDFDTWLESVELMAGFKLQHGLKALPGTMGRLMRVPESRAGFETRLRDLLQGRPDLALTNDEREELERGGYTDLSELAEAYKGIEGKLVRMGDEMPYDRFSQLMADNSISEAARAKMYYYVTGRGMVQSTVTAAEIAEHRDHEGNITDYVVKSYNKDGGVITSRTYKSKKAAEVEFGRLTRQSELNSIDMLEKLYDRLPGTDATTAKMLRDVIGRESGIDIDKVIGKEENRRTDEEKAALQEYLNTMARECQDAWDRQHVDVNQQRLQPDWQEAYDMGYNADEQQRSDISIEREDNPNDPQAQAAWQGVEDRIRQDAADRADQRRAEGEKMAYKGKGDMQGMLRPLTINEESSERDPQTGERKKKTVYLVNGTIAIEPNGNGLSREGTDKTIYVYDPETGDTHELDPFGGAGVLSVGDVISMEDYLADNEQQSQSEVQQAAETAQGKVKVNTPFETPQGRKGVVQSIEGDNAIVLFADGEMEQASMPLAEVQQYADALRRKEYEARHPQTPAEQPQQPNTATEGQTPTAQQTTPQEGGNETRAKQIAETIKNVFGGNIDRYITHLSNTINSNRKRDRGDVSENSYNLTFVRNNRGLVEQYLTGGENAAEDTRTPAQRTYDDVVAKLGADRASKKIDATAKVKADRLTKAQKALKTAQEAADNTEYGSKEEQKAEEAVVKAQAEYDAAQQDMAAWDEVRKLRDQALLAQAEQEEQQRKAELERKRAEETEAQRKQREEYEAEQARRKAEAEAAERRRQEENERLRQQAANPQPTEQPAPIEGTKGQASQLAIARQELADDPEALAMLDETEPRTLVEVAATLLASGKNATKLLKEDFKRETGYSDADVKRYPFLFAGADKGGITLARFGEMVVDAAREYGVQFDENDATAGIGAALELLGSVGSQADINDYITNSRIAEAYDYHNTALAAARASMLEAYGMTEGEYESYMSWLEDAIEQGKSTLSDEEFNQLFNVYEQGQETDVARGNQEGAETTERPEGAETDTDKNGERGNGETDAGTAEVNPAYAPTEEEYAEIKAYLDEHPNATQKELMRALKIGYYKSLYGMTRWFKERAVQTETPTEQTEGTESTGINLPVSEIEERFELKAPTTSEEFLTNIDEILKQYADRKAAFYMVYDYQAGYPQYQQALADKVGATTREDLQKWCAKRQTQLRRGVDKERREKAAEVAVDNIINQALQASAEMDEQLEQQATQGTAEGENQLVENFPSRGSKPAITRTHTYSPVEGETGIGVYSRVDTKTKSGEEVSRKEDYYVDLPLDINSDEDRSKYREIGGYRVYLDQGKLRLMDIPTLEEALRLKALAYATIKGENIEQQETPKQETKPLTNNEKNWREVVEVGVAQYSYVIADNVERSGFEFADEIRKAYDTSNPQTKAIVQAIEQHISSIKVRPDGSTQYKVSEETLEREEQPKQEPKAEKEEATEQPRAAVGEKEEQSGNGEKVKNEAAPKQKIDDVGEKIGGARKDLAQKMGAKINLDADTFPKMFPKFDLKKAVEQGLDPKLASSVYFLRIAAQKEYKSWLKHSTKGKALSAAKFFAAYAKQFLENGNTSTDFKDNRWTFTEYGKKHIECNLLLFEKIYEKFGNAMFDLDLAGYEINPIERLKGIKYFRKNEKGNSEEYQPAYEAVAGYSVIRYEEGGLDKAIDEVVKRMAESVSYNESHPYKLSHYYMPGEANSHYIGVKLGGKVVALTEKMSDNEASQYLREHEAELQEKAKRLDEERKQSKQGGTNTKWKPELGLGGGRARVGNDYRNGKDVSAEDFRKTFGFRGVEFGNYVTQAERQRFINEAYDAMMDLAALLNVSPRALSLGGRLGFAIGARGGGNAMAHYEPDLNVINLTKSKGAGSLAHEWWHALDYYFNRMGDRRKTPATANRRAEDFNPGQRREMEDAFVSLMEKINGSDYRKRSVALDAALNKDYYTNPTELGARAFQDYVQRRLTDKGQVNDFLSSFTPEEQWNGKAETYPYPTGKDTDAIDERFDNLFGTMLEREDEQGNVMLYERVDGKAAKVSARERKLRDAIVDLLRKAGIDVVMESEEGQRVLDMGNGREQQHRVYHGSGADFERFDHSHMGEGEGAQSFGWGTYVTEVEGIGRRYARAMGQPTYQGRKYNDIRDYWNGDEDTQFVILQLLRYLEREPSRTLQEAIDFTDKVYELRIARYNGQNEDIRRRTILNSLSKDDFNTSSTLYTVEIPEDNGSNYLEWDKKASDKQTEAIKNALMQNEAFVTNLRNEYDSRNEWTDKPPFEEWLENVASVTSMYGKENGKRLYNELSNMMGSEQAASEFLHSAGFVGIKYPADYYNGGRADNAKNYVIFNDGDLQITDKVKFFRTESGEVYGFTMGGKIYLDPKIATAETPIHEYTHLWAAALRDANPKAWEQLKSELEKDKDLMAYVHRLYPELKGDELMDEVFAHFSGRRGAERLRAEQERMEGETQSIVGKAKVIAMFENLRNALKRFWNAARDLFAGKSVKNESAEDFADMVLADLLNGFDPRGSSDVRFRGEEEPVFYSNAMRAVENIKQERATPEQWVKMIEKNGGLKAGEDKWLGLSEWLKGSDAKTLTKGEVLDYIRANEIQIEEVSYSESAPINDTDRNYIEISEVPSPMRDGMIKLNNELNSLVEEELENNPEYTQFKARTAAFKQMTEKYGDKFGKAFVLHGGNLSVRSAEQIKNAANILGIKGVGYDRPINSTRLQYTTEGLDNKREIVLTVPTIEPWNEHDEVHFGEAGGGRAVAWVRFGETTDADGKRVLVIDEIQSKRHQEGRERGYMQPYEKIKDEMRAFQHAMEDKYGSFPYNTLTLKNIGATAEEVAQMKSYEASVLGNGVPDAPFEKNWHEVAMKRMLRFAAENGYDKVAWTKGEQQAERYGIGGVLDYIRRGDKKDANTIPIEIKATNHQKPIYFDVDLNGNVTYSMWEEFSGKNLSDIVGKEIANKLLNAPDETKLEGNGLRYGGEGMKGFYDQILPRFMDKYGKKWGVKTGEVELPNIGDNGLTMWSVDVTDDMRESVMRGQPLFRPKTQSREGGEEAAQGEWYDRGSVERIGEFVGYSPKRIAAMNARQEQTARNKFRDAAEKLHLSDNITFADTIDDVQGLTDEQRKEWRRKKGWYSPRTGKIVIILGNHKSMDDVMKSILHEGVAHHGLRQMFGEHFNTFLDNVYRVASPEIRDRINTMAKKHGWDFREATEEYLAMLAEDTDFERPENQTWWRQVKAWFIDLLHKIGFKLHDAYDTITDNELRYILWRSYENLVNPGRYNSVVEEAKDIAKQYDLKVGRWDVEWTIEDREPNATTVYNGRIIPVWATNGRRNGINKGGIKPSINLNEIAEIKAEAENDGFVAGIGIDMTMTDGNVYHLWVGADKEEEDYETTEFYPQDYDDDIPNEEMTRRFGKFFGENVNKIFGSIIGGYIMTSGRRGFTLSHDEIMRMGGVRNDRKGSDYNVAADGVAEDAAEYAKRDAEYMEAVNSGDMEKAQRMVNEAAKRAMPDTKVVDKNGNPLVVYHGTKAKFNIFRQNPDDLGFHFGNKSTARNRVGRGKETKLVPAFIKLNNPIVFDEDLGAWEADYMVPNLYKRGIITEKEARSVMYTPTMHYKRNSREANRLLKELLIGKGYDGIIYNNYHESNGSLSYAVFSPSQIKSADPVTYDDNGNVIPLSQRFNEGSDDIRFRDGEDEETGAPKPQARGAYERMVSSAASQWKEAMQDSMLSLKKLYQAVSQAYKGSTKGVYRIEDEKGYENAYLAENRMHSMSEAQIHAYQQDYMKPLQRAIHALTHGKREAYETLTDYMMAKHGLERNEVMAKREAKKAWEEKYKSEQGNPNYTATKNAVFANIDAGVDDLYLEYRKQDYAGLTALTGIEDVEEAEKEAQRMVDEYEQQHDTTDLWIATNRATRRSLFKMLESGLLSPERHAEIRDMYQYYIPLQGFDSDVAEDVYAYMGSDGTRLYGTTIRAAKGRKSKADDPIATIAMNGEAAIRRGNRNLMKQHFLRFVQSHPSDLVSINDVWLRKNANGEWEQYFDADLKETDTPEEVARKVRDFNERMEQEAAANPDLYKRSRDLPNVPFRVLNVRDMEQHQVMVQVDGKNYLLTINGNPRAAQALNGLTNPDVFTAGFIGTMMNATQSVVRTLSQFYTTRNPNFVLSNFLRDAVYTNSMVLAKESPNYALNFHKNFLLLPNERMGVLFASWENGKLREKLANGTASNMEKMFYDFMMNGGETGWTSLRDIEKHKRDLKKALKREGNIAASALNKLGDFFDITNRMIENHARFTAYVTSIEMGRSVERAVWDAKEISVNFNKKGAGDKFLKAKNQTFVGKVGAFVSGLGRGNYAFWNASLQGLNNIARIGKRNPAKFMAVATTLMGLGVAIPLLNALLGGDDDDDKNAYWNLPEYVRRSNICFRFTKDMPWITIPLPIEFRAIYGLGELGSGVALGKEYYSKGELTKQVAAQFSQVLPLDFMEGGGGWHCLYPTYIKPVIEAYSNQSWTGLPIYRKNTYGQYDVAPEWQRAYSNTNNQIMAATKWLNEATGGDEVQGGNIDFNPARIEYMLRGYLGGYFTVADQVIKMGETATGNREFEWRNMMLANRVVKEGDERTEARKLTNEYFNLKEEYDKTDKSLKAYKKKQDEGTLSVVGQAHYIALMNDSEEYGRYLVFGTYNPLFDAYYKQIKEANAAGDSEEAKRLERGQNELRREMVNIIHDMDNGGTFDRKKVATGINENLKKMQNDKLWDAQDKAINKSIEADNALNPTDNVEE